MTQMLELSDKDTKAAIITQQRNLKIFKVAIIEQKCST